MQGRSKVLHLINPVSRVQIDIASNNNMAWSGINFVNVNTFPWPSWKGRNNSLGVRRLKKIDRWCTPCVVGFKASAHKGVKF